MNVVLVYPEIPQNTGNIAVPCARHGGGTAFDPAAGLFPGR